MSSILCVSMDKNVTASPSQGHVERQLFTLSLTPDDTLELYMNIPCMLLNSERKPEYLGKTYRCVVQTLKLHTGDYMEEARWHSFIHFTTLPSPHCKYLFKQYRYCGIPRFACHYHFPHNCNDAIKPPFHICT